MSEATESDLEELLAKNQARQEALKELRGAVESEHQRLTKQLCRATWEKGFYQGAHKRLRTAIILAKELCVTGTDTEGIHRLLTEVLLLDDQVSMDKPIKEVSDAVA